MMAMKREPAMDKESGWRDRLIRFLSNPDSYPRRPRKVSLVQTHASWVFIAPPYVFKVKKPVNYGFLNFSTLAGRRHYCEREVILNRRLSPRIYLGVVPITSDGRNFAFDGPGRVVEYAVKMRRLSPAGFLNKLVEAGSVGANELNRIAAVLAKFYHAQHPTPDVEEWGRISRLKISTSENFRQTKEFVGRTLSRTTFDVVRAWTNRFYGTHVRLFASRIRNRWIRDCHGDLHLDHIHLTKKDINIYDCIEFNDRFRYVDVANDIAFLAMDLDFRDRSDLAACFVSRMVALLKDNDLTRLMDFYKCYRAYVRGKVESLHSVTDGVSAKERRSSATLAARYFRLALNYIVAGSRPLVLVVMGRIASGKSTLAKALGEELGWPVVSSDHVRKSIAGIAPHQRITGPGRERLYSQAMTVKTYRMLSDAALNSVRAGRSVIVDATFSRRNQRRRLIEKFKHEGVGFRFIELKASDHRIKSRLRDREGRTGEVSDARLEDFSSLSARYQPPSELSRAAIFTVSSTQSTGMVARVLRSLAKGSAGGL